VIWRPAVGVRPAVTLATLKELGVDRVRVLLTWASVAPEATSRHRPAFNQRDPNAYPNAPSFRAVVEAVGRRYDGWYVPTAGGAALPRVDFWSIWSEPNHGVHLSPQTTTHDKVEVDTASYPRRQAISVPPRAVLRRV
jgi:hypothetical protein